jgi:hypothetical protein
VGASVRHEDGAWIVEKAVMSRSARRLMEGWVRVPGGSPACSGDPMAERRDEGHALRVE